MAARLLVVLLALPWVIDAQTCSTDQDSNILKPPSWQNGKTKSASRGLAWLSKYMLPVPASAYNVTGVNYFTDTQNGIEDMLWDVNWWKVTYECIDDSQLYSNLTLGYCNSTIYDNGTCQDNAWLGAPLAIEEDLNNWASWSYFPSSTIAKWERYGTYFMTQANSSKPRSIQKEFIKQADSLASQAKTAYYGSEFCMRRTRPAVQACCQLRHPAS
jgi:hypothetical protein